MSSPTSIQPPLHNPTAVIVTGGTTANALGIIRSFGRRGILVVYVDSEAGSFAAHSRYVNKHVICKESDFISLLEDFGKHNPGTLIVPVGDDAVLALSKHRDELEQFYHLPLPKYETAQKLVNKKIFYRMLNDSHLPYPKTYFPNSITELVSLGKTLAYPYIVKPAYSLPFQKAFGRKVFQIKSLQDLARAEHKLRDKNMEVMLQDIIPGREIYAFFTYFNKLSEPMVICGWDKIRQYPLDFGFGTFCKSTWRPAAAKDSLQLLQTMGYHGFAEVEVKRDPWDGEYKIIEINARTSLQNTLAVACGMDIAYAAYLDASGYSVKPSLSFRSNVSWADDFLDTVSFFQHVLRRDIGIREIIYSLNPRKIRSVAAWDDPLPLAFQSFTLGQRAFRLILSKLNHRFASKS